MSSAETGSSGPSVHYTCLIRLPFPRGDFIDPTPVDWDATKDKSLWKIISKAANSKDLNWPELSSKFQVSLPFLLQQAAWLYERHFAQMKAQMKKLGASTTPLVGGQESPGSSSPAVGSGPLQRPGSRGSRTPSTILSQTRDSPVLASATLASPTSRIHAPPISRTPSTRTVTQSRIHLPPSPRQPTNKSFRSSFGSHPKAKPALEDVEGEDESPPGPSDDSDSQSSEDQTSQSMARSQAFQRPRALAAISSDGDAEDDDESSSGGFLPFAAGGAGNDHDPAATLRTSPSKRQSFENARSRIPSQQTAADSSESSASSAAAAPVSDRRKAPSAGKIPMTQQQRSPAAALSPRHRAELAKLSPRVKKDGSDGTPSMGSSFSDLDDSSVTKSALEDALLSNMQNGGMGSRMSTISQALRSKYL